MKLVLTFTEHGRKIRRIVTTLRPEFEHLEMDRIINSVRLLNKVEQILNDFPSSNMTMSARIEKE